MGLLANKRTIIILAAILLALTVSKYSGFTADKAKDYLFRVGTHMPGCTCHSKNPSIVRMHNALQGEDCSQCHNSNDNLVARKRDTLPPANAADEKKRVKTEAICRKCHLANGTIITDGLKK